MATLLAEGTKVRVKADVPGGLGTKRGTVLYRVGGRPGDAYPFEAYAVELRDGRNVTLRATSLEIVLIGDVCIPVTSDPPERPHVKAARETAGYLAGRLAKQARTAGMGQDEAVALVRAAFAEQGG